MKFLSQASRDLSASTDYEATLLAVAGMALPYPGSWCIVDLVRPDGSVRRLGIIHPDPAKQEHAARLKQSWPPDRDDPMGLPRALNARATEIVPEVPDELLVEVARSEEKLRDLRALGIGSVLVVPLLPRGRLLGAMTFGSAETGHQYDESDVALAEELGARCGVAVDTYTDRGGRVVMRCGSATTGDADTRLPGGCPWTGRWAVT